MIKELDFFEELESDLKDELTLLKGEWVFLVKVIDYIDKTESYYIIDRNTKENEFVSSLYEALIKLWEKMEFYFTKYYNKDESNN